MKFCQFSANVFNFLSGPPRSVLVGNGLLDRVYREEKGKRTNDTMGITERREKKEAAPPLGRREGGGGRKKGFRIAAGGRRARKEGRYNANTFVQSEQEIACNRTGCFPSAWHLFDLMAIFDTGSN